MFSTAGTVAIIVYRASFLGAAVDPCREHKLWKVRIPPPSRFNVAARVTRPVDMALTVGVVGLYSGHFPPAKKATSQYLEIVKSLEGDIPSNISNVDGRQFTTLKQKQRREPSTNPTHLRTEFLSKRASLGDSILGITLVRALILSPPMCCSKTPATPSRLVPTTMSKSGELHRLWVGRSLYPLRRIS